MAATLEAKSSSGWKLERLFVNVSHLCVLQKRPNKGPWFGSRHIDFLEKAIRSISISENDEGVTVEPWMTILSRSCSCHIICASRHVHTCVSIQCQFRRCCVSVLFLSVFVSLASIQPLYWHSVGSPLTPFSLVLGQLVRKLRQLSFSFRLALLLRSSSDLMMTPYFHTLTDLFYRLFSFPIIYLSIDINVSVYIPDPNIQHICQTE